MSTGIGIRDIGRTGVAAIALLAGALLLFPVSAAAGSCSSENRVDHRNAECLYAWWKNRGLLKKSPWHVSNQCPELGKVVAKVDLVAARDRTIHLTDRIPRDGDTRHRIRNVYCCSDLSAACNRSDILSDAACVRQFERGSPAARTCRNAAATYSGENQSCAISAECRGRVAPGGELAYKDTSIAVPIAALGDVHNCDGWLHDEACDVRPLGLSAGDARAEEAEGATLDFTVTLSRPYWQEVTVLYSTSDGTARAWRDYRGQMGYLTFAPGETEKTVSVPVIDDDLDEGAERMWLSLNFQSPAWVRLSDPAGMGTIVNTDRMPKAWIARFGRSVAEQVLDAVDARMRAKPAPGGEARLAGQRIGIEPLSGAGTGGDTASGGAGAHRTVRGMADRLNGDADPAGRGFASRLRSPGYGETATERDLLPGSSFSLTAETDGEAFVSIWGRGAVTRFSGRGPAPAPTGGALPVEGEAASAMLGADWTRGDWTAGLVVSHSLGDGGYRGAGGPGSGSGTGGAVSARLIGIWPWARHSLSERLSVWGVAGYGGGSLTLKPDPDGTRAGTIRTGMDLTMAAVGMRGVALDGDREGLTLAVKTDAMIVRAASDVASGAGGNLAAAQAEVTRLGLGLEVSRPFRLAGGSVLAPRMEIAMRHDGGDAETGFGADFGAGLAWTVPRYNLRIELRGRGLLTHEAKGFRQRGFSGSLAWDPKPSTPRGPALMLTRTVGDPASSGADVQFGRTTLAGPAAFDRGSGSGAGGDGLRQRRLEARLGYGFGAFGGRFISAPETAVGLSSAGQDYCLGWRLKRGGRARDGNGLELAVEVRRREGAGDRPTPAEHAVGLRVTLRF
ncbi:MAG: hypothetical protein OXE57_02010 [Alphaproteobacteria bacterium]|nr:hypothetical protein [Alphaproteobacteria bacterium]